MEAKEVKTFHDIAMEQELQKFNRWLVFENKGDTIHCVGFEEEPSANDIQGVLEELKTDPEFGVTDKVFKSMTYTVVNKEVGLEAVKRIV